LINPTYHLVSTDPERLKSSSCLPQSIRLLPAAKLVSSASSKL
jgi:hypothetical protein